MKEFEAVAHDCARGVRGCTTDAQYQDLVERIAKAIGAANGQLKYLIWSNEHRAWWAPGALGYQKHFNQAGVYSRQSAIEICRRAIPSALHCGVIAEIPVLVDDVDAFLAGQNLPPQI